MAREITKLASRRSPLGQIPAGWRQFLDSVVADVPDVYVALTVHNKPTKHALAELARVRTGLSPLRERIPGRRKLLDAIVIDIRHVEVAGAIERNVVGRVELAGTATPVAPPGQFLTS